MRFQTPLVQSAGILLLMSLLLLPAMQTLYAVTSALSAVGLGSVPSWLRPFSVLSNGEQFRAGLARLLLSDEKAVVLDEFTSVIDRQVARIASGAFQKACGWLLRTLCCLLFVTSARVFYRKLVVFLC